MTAKKLEDFLHYGMLAVIVLICILQVTGLALMIAKHTEQDAKCEVRSK